MKLMSRIVPGLTLLCVLVVPVNIFSSGIWIETTFVLKHRPDRPAKAFHAGELGILWPQFERRYLVIAYRHLAQKPLTAEERQSLDDAAKPRVTPPDMPYDPDPPVTAWQKARSYVLGLENSPQIATGRYQMQGYGYYPNCGDDAFTNAASTAMSRAQSFGVASPPMRVWVAGQDAVFQNCSIQTSFAADQTPVPLAKPFPPSPWITRCCALIGSTRWLRPTSTGAIWMPLPMTLSRLRMSRIRHGASWRRTWWRGAISARRPWE